MLEWSSESKLATVKKEMVVVLALIFITTFLLLTPIGKRQIVVVTSTNTMVVVENKTDSYYRIQVEYLGNCIDSSDGVSLKFLFCDPTQQQAFHFLEDGRLRSTSTGLCVSREWNVTGPLTLKDCWTGSRFRLINGSYLQTTESIARAPNIVYLC